MQKHGWYSQTKHFPRFVRDARFMVDLEFPGQYIYEQYVKAKKEWCATPDEFASSVRDFQTYVQMNKEDWWFVPADWDSSNKISINMVNVPEDVTLTPIVAKMDGDELVQALKCFTRHIPVIVGLPTEVELEKTDASVESRDLFYTDRAEKEGWVETPKERVIAQSNYHAVSIWGYDDQRQAFRFQNSWGDSWGDQGYGWVSYDFVREHMDGFKAIIPHKEGKRAIHEGATLLDYQRWWFELLDNKVSLAP